MEVSSLPISTHALIQITECYICLHKAQLRIKINAPIFALQGETIP